MPPRLFASEFPNDNPELHDGLVWACPAPCAAALPTLRLRAVGDRAPRVLGPSWEGGASEPATAPASAGSSADAGAPQQEQEESLEPEAPELELLAEGSAVADAPVVVENPPAVVEDRAPRASSPFEALLAALAAVTLELGATRAAASLPALFGVAPLNPSAFDASARAELVACGILDASGRVNTRFASVARAWRAVLEGSSEDLAACGATGLDAWCAELVAAAAGLGADRRESLRRALRARGVAAFGLLAAA